MTEKIKLQVGKTYLTRGSGEMKIIAKDGGIYQPFRAVRDGYDYFYQENGSFSREAGISGWDIVSEVNREFKKPAFPEENLANRLSKCITALYTHGIITTAERDKSRARLQTEFPKTALQSYKESKND